MNLFEQAENAASDVTANPEQSTPPVETQPTVPPVDTTKAFAERLKEETTRIRAEAKNEVATSLGYESWDAFQKANNEKIISDNGLDPKTVEPIIEKILSQHPDIIAAREYKNAKIEEDLKKEETDKLFALNQKYGTQFKELSEVGEDVLSLYKQGVPLDKAYGVNHLDELVKSQAQVPTSKSHMQPLGSTGNDAGISAPLTDKDIAMYRRFNPNATEEQIRAYHNKNKK